MAAAGGGLGVAARGSSLSCGRDGGNSTEAQRAASCPCPGTSVSPSQPSTSSRRAIHGSSSQYTPQARKGRWSCALGAAQPGSADTGQGEVKIRNGKRRGSGASPPKEKIPLVVDRIPLDVIFEDEHILVINKPAGVKHEPMHRFVGGSLLNRVVGHLGFEPFTVHRLDMFTSGVLCLAKHVEAAKALHAQFRRSTQQEKFRNLPPHSWDSSEHPSGVHKRYVALSLGTPRTTAFAVEAPIGQHPDHKFARVVAMPPEEGARALTFFYVVSYNSSTRGILLECLPQTGRTHQIRVHLQHFGLPILGDHIYGEGSQFSQYTESTSHSDTHASDSDVAPASQPDLHSDSGATMQVGASTEAWKRGSISAFGPTSELIPHQALHALSLTIVHPYTGETLTFTAAISDDMMQAARLLCLPMPSKFLLASNWR